MQRPTSARDSNRRPRRSRRLDALLVLGLAAIVVAAIVNFVQVGGRRATAPPPPAGTQRATTGETDRTGPAETFSVPLPEILPLPGALRQEGGILWWSDVQCRAGSLELSSGAVATLRTPHCRLWPAPDGSEAIAVSARRSDALEGRGLVLVRSRDGTDEAVLEHSPGFLGSELAWNPYGSTFAVCFETRRGQVIDVITPSQAIGTVRDACFPAWLADGRLALATARPLRIEVDRKVVFDRSRAAKLLPSVPRGATRAVSALAGGDGRLAAALVVASRRELLPFSASLAVLSDTGATVFEARLTPGSLPTAVGLAPGGGAVWYFEAGRSTAVILAVPGGTRLPPFGARWVAWSPDGRYLAAATDDGIVISSWLDGRKVAVVPVRADDVSWTAGG